MALNHSGCRVHPSKVQDKVKPSWSHDESDVQPHPRISDSGPTRQRLVTVNFKGMAGASAAACLPRLFLKLPTHSDFLFHHTPHSVPISTCVSRSRASHSHTRGDYLTARHRTLSGSQLATSSPCSHISPPTPPLPWVHICIQPHDSSPSFVPRPRRSRRYPGQSPLLTLAPNAAARLLAVGPPFRLLWCDVNEAFCFVIKRWPLDMERLIKQDGPAGEG